MKRQSSIWILLLIMNFSCAELLVGTHIAKTQFVPLVEIDCEGQYQQIALFFEGEKLDFEYEVIGMVEAEGFEFTSNEVVIDDLKNRASIQCANGIINLKKQFITKSEIEEDINTKVESTRVFSVPVFTGLAIRIKNVENYLPEIAKVEVISAETIQKDETKLGKEAFLLLIPLLFVLSSQ
jgi:hypothetical protein